MSIYAPGLAYSDMAYTSTIGMGMGVGLGVAPIATSSKFRSRNSYVHHRRTAPLPLSITSLFPLRLLCMQGLTELALNFVFSNSVPSLFGCSIWVRVVLPSMVFKLVW